MDRTPAVDALRSALAAHDVVAAARHIVTVHLAVPVRDGRVATAHDASGRVLPVFLSPDSWEAFQFDGQVTALTPTDFLQVLESVAPDTVLFDPALPTAMAIPAADVRDLLNGEIPGNDGLGRAIGTEQGTPDDELRRRIAEWLAQRGAGSIMTRAWAMRRVVGSRTVPVLALAHDAADEGERLMSLLQGADLPPDLELTVLDRSATELADRSWGALLLSSP